MKTLFLLRHAKSNRDAAGGNDFERTLALKGINDAKEAGKFLKTGKRFPEKIVCSPAARARETIEIVLESAGRKADLVFENKIYSGNDSILLDLIRNSADDKDSLMIVGHNPSIETLAGILMQGHFPDEEYKTCGILALEFDVGKWKDIKEKSGKFIFYKSPAK